MERSGSGIPGQNGPNPAGSYLSAARGTAHEGPVVTHPSQQPGGQRRGEKLLNEPKNPHQHQQELPLCWDVVYQPWDRNCSSPGLGFGGGLGGVLQLQRNLERCGSFPGLPARPRGSRELLQLLQGGGQRSAPAEERQQNPLSTARPALPGYLQDQGTSWDPGGSTRILEPSPGQARGSPAHKQISRDSGNPQENKVRASSRQINPRPL